MKKPQVVRLRDISPAQEQRLQALRAMSRLLDSAFEVPGTSYRIGLDPIIGLIPAIGDLISPLFTIGMLLEARRLAVPKVVQARMILNVAVDTFVGLIPVAGDLFDFAWKANDKNLALLEAHAYEERPASAGDWVFVSAMILILIALAAVPFVVLAWVISLIRG